MRVVLASLRQPRRRVPQLSAKRRRAQVQMRGLRTVGAQPPRRRALQLSAKRWRARAQAWGLRTAVAGVQSLRTLALLLIGIRRRARREQRMGASPMGATAPA
jgi:hypothetical protein